MKGDITRLTFAREKHYSGVLEQQGRVHTDADWLEQIDIEHHLERTTGTDVIGPCGAPIDAAGFGISVAGAVILIGAGRYYAHGILCEHEGETAITAQPDLPGYALPDAAGIYVAYLDVWELHVTALEDPAIREIALGGPDTTTRSRVLAQVKLLRVGDEGDSVNCLSVLAPWNAQTAPSSGTLAARAEPEETAENPCIVPARAGFRGLENQLYRVEVHAVVSADEVAIKWSRENGSVVFAWLGQDALNPNRITVAGTGRDQALGLAAGDWVELSDDVRELAGAAGLLVRIDEIDGTVLTIDPGSETVVFGDFTRNPKVRRWDMRDGAISVDPTVADNWIELENGIEVLLAAGTYRVGDYWLIPARTVSGDIEWPRDELSGLPLARTPHGIAHHYCRLALVAFDGDNWSFLSDCRNLFPPLTELAHLFYVSGDGQEVMPGGALPRPLQVAVMNGQTPVAGARIRFHITAGPAGVLTGGPGLPADIEVPTGADGIAQCTWQLDPALALVSQQVEALWLDAAGQPIDHPIRFNATLSIASQVAYDSGDCLTTAATVEQALDQLCANFTLHYAGGDGQAVMPIPGDNDSRILASPLEVRVANGQWPVAGVTVSFNRLTGAGELLAAGGFVTVGAPGAAITVQTNAEGVAACHWRVDAATAHQHAEAVLTSDGRVARVHFNAALNIASQVAYTPTEACSELVQAGVNTVQEALDQLCQRGAAEEPGIRIRIIRLAQRPLLNDDPVTLADLRTGIFVTCEAPIDPNALAFAPPGRETGRAVCFVTFDYPIIQGEGPAAATPAGYFPFTLAAGGIAASGSDIRWVPASNALDYIASLMQPLPQIPRFLMRLTLKGNFIWGGERNLFVDGDAFGRRGDGRTDLILPTGDNRRGGNFEMWFWLANPQTGPAGPGVLQPVGDVVIAGPGIGRLQADVDTLRGELASRDEQIAALTTRLQALEGTRRPRR